MPLAPALRFDLTRTVASIVAESPRTSRAFEHFGIDYCRDGRAALADVCAWKGLLPHVVGAELAAAVAPPDRPERDWSRESATAVIDHVLEVHHTFVKREIPRLLHLSERVVRKYAATHPEVAKVVDLWTGVARELRPHLAKEELVLFPLIRAMAAAGDGPPRRYVEEPLHVMEAEHDAASDAMAEMRDLASGYAMPDDACGSFRAFWSGLDEFDRDLDVHVRLENDVLFPKAREMARP